jgi:hypothetical protein
MTKEEILKRFAIDADEATKKSAPFTRKTNPTKSSKTLMTCAIDVSFHKVSWKKKNPQDKKS